MRKQALILFILLMSCLKASATLDFNDFIKLVNKNHPNIKLAELDMRFAEARELETKGAFDPRIDSSNFYHRYNSSSKIGQELDAFTSDSAIILPTRFGAQFAGGARYAGGDISTPIKPTGDAGEYFIAAEIPLLRNGFYRNASAIAEKQAKLSVVDSEYEYFRTRLSILLQASYEYFTWTANKDIYDQEFDMLQVVTGQSEFVKEQADLGNLPQINHSEALIEVKMREGKVQSQSRKFQESSFKLNTFMWEENGSAMRVPWFDDVPGMPIEIKEIDREEVNSAQLVALENRPELKSLEISKEITKLDRSFAKNQMLPMLNAFVSPGYQVGGNAIGPSMQAGVNISLPLRVRTAKGKLQQADVKLERIDLKERQILQKIFLEIENAASDINANFQKFLAVEDELEHAIRLEEGEKERFELGDSTLFLVIRRQRARLEAQIRLIETVRDYRQSFFAFSLLQAKFPD
jgi:outer membrane protein